MLCSDTLLCHLKQQLRFGLADLAETTAEAAELGSFTQATGDLDKESRQIRWPGTSLLVHHIVGQMSLFCCNWNRSSGGRNVTDWDKIDPPAAVALMRALGEKKPESETVARIKDCLPIFTSAECEEWITVWGSMSPELVDDFFQEVLPCYEHQKTLTPDQNLVAGEMGCVVM